MAGHEDAMKAYVRPNGLKSEIDDAADIAKITDVVLAQAREHHLKHGSAGLKTLGPCPVCGESLKYLSNDPRLGFIVWCDRVGCLVARGPGAPESPQGENVR